jgi:hypothetical protein
MISRPPPITIVPYVYKDGDDEPRRRSPRLAAQKVAVVGRKSARLASVTVSKAAATVSEAAVTARAAATVSEASVTASEAPAVADPEAPAVPDLGLALVSSPRKRKHLDYKSIVRTRAQKVANIKEQHVQHMQIATAFYNKFGREPSPNSKDVAETGLAHYLDTLRFCMNTMDGNAAPFNALVAEHMPWFEWSVANVEPEARTSCLRPLAVFVLLGLGTAMAFAGGSLASYRILACGAGSCFI